MKTIAKIQFNQMYVDLVNIQDLGHTISPKVIPTKAEIEALEIAFIRAGGDIRMRYGKKEYVRFPRKRLSEIVDGLPQNKLFA